MEVVEEEECLLNKLKEKLKHVWQNGQKIKTMVISKEIVRRNGKDQDPPHHKGIRNGRTTNYLHKSFRKTKTS